MQYQFQKIELKDKPVLDVYFNAEEYDNSELCFGNMFLWKDSWHIEFTIEDDILLLRGKQPTGERFFFPPVLKDPARIMEGMAHCIAASVEEGERFIMYGVNERIAGLIKEKDEDQLFSVREDRNNFDYVYLAEDLIHLAGSKYHGKRNHINKLRATVQTEFRLMEDALVEPCFESYMQWYEKHQAETFDPSLQDEKTALRLALDHWKELGFEGGAILIDGKVEAFSLGEKRPGNRMAIIHIEKANTEFPGLYALINQQTAENVFSDMKYLNREEDMGLPGLRKAKESYHPVKMVKKFIVKQRV